MKPRETLLFVSTQFLFPIDTGGKIRTTQILRGLKGGRWRILLVSPATDVLIRRHKTDLDAVCDEFRWWMRPRRGPLHHYSRLRHIGSDLPIPVRTDLQANGAALVSDLLMQNPAVTVFDFAHAAILAPPSISCPSVLFTHNVEAEIFKRHLQVTENPLMRLLWGNQHRKMKAYESRVLRNFDVVVAVASRDAETFKRDYGVARPFVIPTGVDLDFFEYGPPVRSKDVVFCGSMDWLANQEAVRYFMDSVWEHVTARAENARMTIVGRSPPKSLISEARRRGLNWHFTGFVDDVRDFVRGAVSVLPLRVGGGTRLKVYEAMAMGSPMVATSLGVEGLPINPEEHYLLADEPEEMGRRIAMLLNDPGKRHAISLNARRFVEQNCSYRTAAKAFEAACDSAIIGRRAGRSPS